MNKKIKAILVVIWFVSALIIDFICCLYFEDLIGLSMANIAFSLTPIFCDKELREMKLW